MTESNTPRPDEIRPESASPTEDQTAPPAQVADGGHREWRAIWRLHFYAGAFALPFLLLLAITGLVILYTQPLADALAGDRRVVEDRGDRVTLDRQATAVRTAHPTWTITGFDVPPDREHSTVFHVDTPTGGRSVYVDPYTARVLGSDNPEAGFIRWANQLHGQLDVGKSVPLPTVSALWDDGPVMRDYVIGDLVVELCGVWTLVLAASGIVLWWPRRVNHGTGQHRPRGVFTVRLGERGRGRWRDLHGLPSLLAAPVLALTLVSGLAWSTYWGPHFTSIANAITPNSWTDAPPSEVGTRGDLDRLGNQIHWNTGDIPIPGVTDVDPTTVPAPLSLESVVTIAQRSGMKPGFSVSLPTNTTTADGPVYGAYTVSNSWPRATGEARDLFLNQFTGEELGEQSVYGYGAVSRGMDTLVSIHMGTQFGLVNRIIMTLVCVVVIWSVITAVVMYSKRRRRRSLGLPRRPVDVTLTRRLRWVALGLGVVFPQWGVSALAVLGVDRFVIRRVPRLRRWFGQR